MATALIVAIMVAPISPQIASAQTAAPSLLPLPQRFFHLDLIAPPGVELKIRPAPEGDEGAWAPMLCSAPCKLSVYPGRYRLDAHPDAASGLRDVAQTVDILTDARIEIDPGSRSAHHWGVGLTIAGGVLSTVGMVFSFSQEVASQDQETRIATLSTMGVGVAAMLGGICLLVLGGNRMTVDETWQPSMVPRTSSTRARLTE